MMPLEQSHVTRERSMKHCRNSSNSSGYEWRSHERTRIVGEARNFTHPLVNDEYWEDTALSDLIATKPVLLVFYPMDGDFPATYIWNELRDRAWENEFGITIVGLSISSPYEHKTFIKKRGMNYRLFSDPQNEVAKQYGIVNDLDGMTGISEPRPARIPSQRRTRY